MRLLSAVLLLTAYCSFAEESKLPNPPVNPFSHNLAPAPVGGSFQMDDYIVWGGSVIKGDDNRYYMFASR